MPSTVVLLQTGIKRAVLPAFICSHTSLGCQTSVTLLNLSGSALCCVQDSENVRASPSHAMPAHECLVSHLCGESCYYTHSRISTLYIMSGLRTHLKPTSTTTVIISIERVLVYWSGKHESPFSTTKSTSTNRRAQRGKRQSPFDRMFDSDCSIGHTIDD